MLAFPEFIALYAASLAAVALVGLSLAFRPGSLRNALSLARQNHVFVTILALLPVLVLAVDILDVSVSDAASKQVKYTDWFMQVSGGTVSSLQTRLNYGLLIDASIFFYVWVFAFVAIFSPALLLISGDSKTFKKYSVAMAFNYMVIIPFSILFPVGVTSTAPGSGVLPLLYVHPNWGKLVTDIDPLNNVFPSGHTSLMITTLLIFVLAQRRYRGYSAFLGVASGGIVLSVLLLGVHWPVDVLMGAVVAALAICVSRSERVLALFERLRISGRGSPERESEEPVSTYAFHEPVVYPRGELTLSSFSHQFVLGRQEGVPVSLMPGSIRLNQALYIHHTNLRRAETDEVRQALPVGVRRD